MEQLIKLVTEKTGISESQAKQSVETVISFLKDKLPAGIGNQVTQFMQERAPGIGGITGGINDKLKGFLNK